MPLIPQTRGAFRAPGSRPPAARPPARPPVAPVRPAATPPPTPAPPDYAQQAQTDLAPIYQSLVDQLNESRAAGERGIAGYTHSFANMLGGYNPQAGYNSAAQAQAALDAALQQSLTGKGQDLSQGLAGQLAQINAPGETSSRVIGGINQAATGAANAGLAKGSASLSALLAQGAAAGDYARSLPGYAAGLGLQQTRLLEGSTQQQIGQALANEPRDVLSRTDALQSAATTAQNRKEDLAYRNQQAQATDLYRRAQLGLATKKDAYNEWLQSKKLGLAEQNQTFNQWAKSQGLAIQGQRVTIAQGSLDLRKANAAGTGGYTKGQLKSYSAQAGKIATAAFRGKPGTSTEYQWQPVLQGGVPVKATLPGQVHDKQGNLLHQVPVRSQGTTHLSYQEAMAEMRAAGIPLTVAQQALNSYWSKPGKLQPWEKPGQGRPLKSYQERNPGKAGASARTPEGAKAAAFQIAQSKYGWAGDELAALEQLWNGESGWSYTATNRSSGAAGIPQALGHKLPADYATNPVSQINWGLKYIHDRYKTPSRALAFWQSNSPHWY